MNELNLIVEESYEKLEELSDIDIEHLLDRIEKLSFLNKKYGSIREALEYKDKKREELKNTL